MKEEKRVEALVWSALLKAYNAGLKSAFQNHFDTIVWVWNKQETSCKICETLDGVEMSLEKAEELFPLHPFCSCSIIPKI